MCIMGKYIGIFFSVWILSATCWASPLPLKVNGRDVLTGQDVTVALSANRKKGLVVIFMSATCPCSMSHIEELKALERDFPGFAFVGVHSNAGEAKEPSHAYFEKVKLPFAVIRDSDYKWADQFKALKTPHAFVVQPDGEIAYQGGVSNSHDFTRADRKFLREALDDLEHGRDVKTKVGRTLGCAITRGEKYVW